MRISMLVLLAAVVLAAISATGASTVKIEKIPSFNQPNCYKLSNGTVEVIVTTDIGPRVMAYRFAGGQNMLAELTADAKQETELGVWHAWGGHRLWHAPENKPRTYQPDDDPVPFEIVGNDTIRLMPKVEAASQIQKQIEVKLDADGSHVTLTQTLTNRGRWPIELAVWGLTIVRGGGTTIWPQEPFISHDDELLPARSMTLWHYTDMSDPRYRFGKKYVTLHTDTKLTDPQKIGVANRQGWAAYQLGDLLFVKRFPYIEGANYPDSGCNFESYTAGDFMEVEDLGPLTMLDPGESITNVEHWYLFKDVKPSKDDAAIDANILPLVKKT